MHRALRWLFVTVLLVPSVGCAIVPRNRQRHLADPTMQPSESQLEDSSRRKLHVAREGAAGGDGQPAGGGCGCSN